MSDIRGKTNGAASSEYKLLRLFGVAAGGLIAVALTAGWLAPEQADQARSLVEQFIGWAGAGVALYVAVRGWIKAVIAGQGGDSVQ